ncbi:MAG: glycosyltransferase family 4 protein [Candidatus Omnitrophica bacterium]|nr:glycosyltransferase family 4 protein [Candidatus Omnitrophota bacterium]MCG2708268.1 glycosyltransferase family 4 protein [Candidatus Omnitrophota bacterium]
MKICFLAGANSLHSHRWIKYFVNIGYEVHWISLMPSNELLQNVEFYDLGPLSTNPVRIMWQVIKFRKLIKRISPDILHIHSAGTYGLIGMLSGFHPAIVTAWGSDVLIAGKSAIKKPVIKYVLRNADLITCDADHMINNISKLGIDTIKTKLIYFGVEPDKFSPGIKDKKLLEKWETNDSPVVISLRNLEPVYDIETLINCIPHVLKKIPKVKFIIAGTGSQEERLKKLTELMGVMNNTRFIGRYSHVELPNYLRSSDIYVSTSLSDAGIAASTAEAMATGLAVIITDSGENRKWIQDEKNGLIFPIRNSKILAEKIIYLLKHDEIRKQIGMKGRITIENKNNYYKEMEKMEKLYREIIEARRQKRKMPFLSL